VAQLGVGDRVTMSQEVRQAGVGPDTDDLVGQSQPYRSPGALDGAPQSNIVDDCSGNGFEPAGPGERLAAKKNATGSPVCASNKCSIR
jgi:hypothetical protein